MDSEAMVVMVDIYNFGAEKYSFDHAQIITDMVAQHINTSHRVSYNDTVELFAFCSICPYVCGSTFIKHLVSRSRVNRKRHLQTH